MSLVFLIGRHGSGKSSIGDEMSKLGYKHLSIGLLRRLSRSNQTPSDIPYSLMAAVRRSQPGAGLSTEVGKRLIDFALSFERCVVDGFPTTVQDLDILPRHATIGVVCTSKDLRRARLEHRAEHSQRQWTDGRRSVREEMLAQVILASRRRFGTLYISNNECVTTSANGLLKLLP